MMVMILMIERDQMIKDTSIQYICIGCPQSIYCILISYKKYCSYQSYDTFICYVWFIHTTSTCSAVFVFPNLDQESFADFVWFRVASLKQCNNDCVKNPNRVFETSQKKKQSRK